MTMSDSKVSPRRESLRSRENGVVVNGKEERKDGAQSEQHSKLRNRNSISKPETLQYEPNLEKGLHAKIMKGLLNSLQNKNKDRSTKKRKSASPVKDSRNGEKKPKPEVQAEVFDSYAFSMQLINTEDDTVFAQKRKESNEKYVLLIGNLPADVTQEQLEEHFRKTGGIKAIRIPKEQGSDTGRGIAYMEFDGRISLGIALRLHQTTLGGRQINVEFSSTGGGKSHVKRK